MLSWTENGINLVDSCCKLEPKWCVDEPWTTHLRKAHYGSNLGTIHYFVLYIIAPCGYYIVMIKILKFPSEILKIVKLWISLFTHCFVFITSSHEFQIKSSQGQSCDPWRYIYNNLLSFSIENDLSFA